MPASTLSTLLRRTALLAVVGFVVIACESPIRVSTDTNPAADFSAYASYAWISPEPLIPQVKGVTEGPPLSPIDDSRIRAAVAAELKAKGWRETDDREAADLIVSYGLGTEERTEIIETPNVGFYGSYRYGGWYGGSSVRSQQITEGTLTLEFFDRRTKQAAWVGWASKRLSRSSSENRNEAISTAIQKILQGFPAVGAATSKPE